MFCDDGLIVFDCQGRRGGPRLYGSGEDFAHAACADSYETVADAFGTVERFVLLHKDFEACAALSGEYDDKLHIFIPCSHHGGNGATLAVTADAESGEVYMGVGFQGVEHCLSIFGEEMSIGGIERTGAGTHATVVVAEDSDAVRSQIVGKDQEGLVEEDFLVAVLLAAAGDEKQAGVGRRGRLRLYRIGEGTFEVDGISLRVSIVGSDNFLTESVGWERCLWTAELIEGVGGTEGDGFF